MDFEVVVEREDVGFAAEVLCVSVLDAACYCAESGILDGLEFGEVGIFDDGWPEGAAVFNDGAN